MVDGSHPIDGDAQAAEHRQAQRAAQLGGCLAEGGDGAGALGGRVAHDQIGGQRADGTRAQAPEHGARDDDPLRERLQRRLERTRQGLRLHERNARAFAH